MKHSISMLWPDGLKKALTFSYDDGVMQDLKLISLFRLYGLKATFNLNSGFFGLIGTSVYEGREIDRSHVPEEDIAHAYSGFEVAVHTTHHPHLLTASPVHIVEETLSDRMNLEVLTGYPVRGMAYPFGDVNATIEECVRSCGIVFSRGTKTTGNYSLPVDPYDWMCSCHHNDLEPLIDPFLADDRRLMLLSCWGHSYEFDMTQTWDEFENQLERLGGNDDVWYATNIEIFDYIAAYNALRYTVDADIVMNPSCQDVFIECDGETVCIPGGATVKL